jgi:hypothetical protein
MADALGLDANEVFWKAVEGGQSALLEGAATLPKAPQFWGDIAQINYGYKVMERSGGKVSWWEATLRNPSGGMTGPGDSWGQLGIDLSHTNLLGPHSIIHDADGFLYTHGLGGNGYAACPHCGLFPGSPLSGQVFGIGRRAVLAMPPWYRDDRAYSK